MSIKIMGTIRSIIPLASISFVGENMLDTDMRRAILIAILSAFLAACSVAPPIEGEEASSADILRLSLELDGRLYEEVAVPAALAMEAVRQDLVESGDITSQNPRVHIDAETLFTVDGIGFSAAGNARVGSHNRGDIRECTFDRFFIGYQGKVYRLDGSVARDSECTISVNGRDYILDRDFL